MNVATNYVFPVAVIAVLFVLSLLAIRSELRNCFDIGAALARMASYGKCPFLVYNDEGKWAITFEGFLRMDIVDEQASFVDLAEVPTWYNTPVDAVHAAMLKLQHEGVVFGEFPLTDPLNAVRKLEEALAFKDQFTKLPYDELQQLQYMLSEALIEVTELVAQEEAAMDNQ